MKDIINLIKKEETYYWSTHHYHNDNMETMSELLDSLPEEVEIIFKDGTYAEILVDGEEFEVHASGDGDFFSHKVEFKRK